MAAVIGKRKRQDVLAKGAAVKKAAIQPAIWNGKQKEITSSQPKPRTNAASTTTTTRNGEPSSGPTAREDVTVQIVTGSYERVLHGISANIPMQMFEAEDSTDDTTDDTSNSKDPTNVNFSDTFLFAAHTSAIRCLALSPPTDSDKRILATGSSDERINLYQLSTVPPPKSSLPSLTGISTAENPRNKSLGNLIHHDRAITCVQFPIKSKLFTAAEDNTIAISRTRDWTMLSSIKAPIPKAQGRPSGDTAAPGEVPAGVNDFAVHPSHKLMLSVGRGERCLRLWNLMTGKKAGVLNFDRELLAQVAEGKYGSGEGRRVLWDEKGEMYVVGFEKGAAIFGIDSKPKAIVKPDRPTKFHQMKFLPGTDKDTLAISTEDGRLVFFRMPETTEEDVNGQDLPQCACIAQLGGHAAGLSGRIKDFEILPIGSKASAILIVTASSDGAVRLWRTRAGDYDDSSVAKADAVAQIGSLIGTLETSNRLTCLGAFVLDGKVDSREYLDDLAAVGASAKEGESESDDDDSE